MKISINSYQGKRVLITGASGFIGKKLAARLKKLGARLYAITRKELNQSEIIDEWLVGDLTDYEITQRLISQSKIDIVFHLAGYVSGLRGVAIVRPTFRNNLLATLNLMITATDSSISRLVLAGSIEEPRPGEDDSIPVSPYAASKWACTQYARMFHRLYSLPVTIGRIAMVYGPGDDNFNNLIPYVIKTLYEKKRPEISSGKRLADWVYIDDIVEGLLKMGLQPGIEGETIELGSGKLTSVKEVCLNIKKIMGSNMDLEFGSIPDRPYEREIAAKRGTTQLALDWYPKIPISLGLKRTIQWINDMTS